MRLRLHHAAVVAAGALLASACVSDAASPNNRVGEPVVTATTIDRGSPSEGTSPDDPIITVVSSDREFISGGDARIRIENSAPSTVVRLNGEDVTASFSTTNEGALEGVISNLALGANSLAVTTDGLTFAESLTNHPRRGPIFSGPQTEPLVCTTEQHGLGPPVDNLCSAPTQVFWTYVGADGALQRLESSPDAVDPAKITIDGVEVDFIIRNEVGTINRGVYWVHSLDPEPAIGGLDQPWSGTDAWNERLVVNYGPGCGATHSQGSPSIAPSTPAQLGGPVNLGLLRDGYAVASSTFTTFATHCNDVVSAETTMMVKERFIEGYGEPELTFGLGSSGGAMQQFLVAQNYPGLLDAVVAGLPFPDMVTTMPGVLDCELLGRYYETESGQALGPDQRAAINGQLVDGACPFAVDVFGPTFSPAAGCDPSLTFDTFNAFFNPTGLRCSPWDAAPQLYAVPETEGDPPAPFDNVGVQYGLEAYQNRVIGIGEFLHLNEFIGGRNSDGGAQVERTVADPGQIERLYREGRVNQAGGDLRRVPIVLIDVFTDAAGDIHDRWRAFSIRERIGGGASTPPPNVAFWTVQTNLNSQFTLADYFSSDGGTNLSNLSLAAVRTVDEWATAQAELDSDAPAVDLAATRPESAADRCVLITGDVVTGDTVNEPGGACGDLPVSGDTRTVAGADVESLVLKCERRDIDLADYPGQLSTVAVARLGRIFPDGVCDYDRPGTGQTRLGEPFLDYSLD